MPPHSAQIFCFCIVRTDFSSCQQDLVNFLLLSLADQMWLQSIACRGTHSSAGGHFDRTRPFAPALQGKRGSWSSYVRPATPASPLLPPLLHSSSLPSITVTVYPSPSHESTPLPHAFSKPSPPPHAYIGHRQECMSYCQLAPWHGRHPTCNVVRPKALADGLSLRQTLQVIALMGNLPSYFPHTSPGRGCKLVAEVPAG